MKKLKRFICALLTCATGFVATNASAKCRVGMVAELKVTMSGLQPQTHVGIDGHDAIFAIDSGAFFSTISPGSADELGLKQIKSPPDFWISGVGGAQHARIATVKTFTLTGVPLHDMQFVVAGSEVGAMGLLGQNVLGLYDTEYDLAGGVVRMMKSVDCGDNTALAYWAGTTAPFSVVPIEWMTRERPHIIGTVYVNGTKLRALFDTGASTSILRTSTAERLGVKPGDPGVTESGRSSGLGRKTIATYIGPFASFMIGDEEIKNTRLRIGDLGDDLDADMLLGADFFLSHRLYVAPKQQKIYFTYNGGRVFDLRNIPPVGTDVANNTAASTMSAEPEPTTAEAYAQRGGARAARKDREGGVADLSRAIALAPDNADYRLQRATLATDAQQALDDVEQVLKLRPADVDALIMRARLRRHLDRTTDIRADLDAAAAAAAPASDNRLDIADLYQASDTLPQAIEQYELWIAKHPNDYRQGEALNRLCWSRALLGQQLDVALQNCNAALHIEPKSPAFHDSRGLVQLRMGKFTKAITDYDAALAANPKLAWSLYGRGIAKLRLGNKEAGEADMKAALTIQSDMADVTKRYGVTP